MTKAQLLAVGSTAGLEAGGERPPTKIEIAARLRVLADEMDDIAAAMDYYGGFAGWAQHGREIAGAGNIARQWAAEIEAANVEFSGGAPLYGASSAGTQG